MAYHTLKYLLAFFPAVLLVYQLVPRRARWAVLLLFSYAFYWLNSGKLLLYLLGVTLVTYDTCMWITRRRAKRADASAHQKEGRAERSLEKGNKAILATGILLLLGGLGYLKYAHFFAENWNALAEKAGNLPVLTPGDLILPIGISFYTLMAIGYMADVYWQKAEVSPHPGKTALFLAFFPQTMEGPICAYSQTADALWRGDPISYENFLKGSVRILWGLFKKLVIADRLNVLVGTVFEDYTNYQGAAVAVAAVAYTIQLYMEFSGCIDIVIGSGRMFNVHLPENFRQPFFAVDAADFWRRWHITLGVWFRTYVFYPVSLSSPVKKWNRFAKKHLGKYAAKLGTLAMSLFPVWLCNGLWHGPRWSFVFFGMYYFAVLFLTEACIPMKEAVLKKLHISQKTPLYTAIRIVKTWLIIFTGELFFRADGLRAGFHMFGSIFKGPFFTQLFGDMWSGFGLDRGDAVAIIAGCVIVFAVGVLREKKWLNEEKLGQLRLPARWAVYFALLFAVIVFGAYGSGYDPVDLIYAGF